MKRIAVFGTFDIFHPGHISYLKQAKALGNYLLVVLARDQNVLWAKKKRPLNPEVKRARIVRKAGLADKVIRGSKTRNYFRTLRTYNIDTIALGYDQKPTIKDLKKQLRRHRLAHLQVVRLKPYNPKKYKTSRLSNDV